jgi:hypothetical protein
MMRVSQTAGADLMDFGGIKVASSLRRTVHTVRTVIDALAESFRDRSLH